MSNKRRSFRDKIKNHKGLTTIGSARYIGTAISGLFWMYMASLLGTENYGEISYFISIAGIAAALAFFGSTNTILVYIPKGVKIFASIASLTLISSVITAVILFFVFSRLDIGIYVIGSVIFSLGINDLLAKKLYGNYAKYFLLQRGLLVVLSISLYYLMGNQGVVLGYALSFFTVVYIVYRGYKENKIDLSIIKTKSSFIINNYAISISRSLNASLDKLIIFPLFGFSLLGNYALGLQFLSVLMILPSFVYVYILPQDAVKKSNVKLKILTISASVILAILSIILVPMFLPFIFPEFVEAVLIVQILSLAIIPRTINMTFISKFLGSEKPKIVLFGSIIQLLILISLISVLAEQYGIYGIAIALVLAITSETIFLVIMNRRLKKDNKIS